MDNFAVLVILGLMGLGSAQAATNISCFVCSPQSHTALACNNIANNVPLVNCSTLVAGSNWRFSCYSEFLNYNNVSGNTAWNNRTGVYRGCVTYPATGQNAWCSRSVEVNVTRPSCITCSTTRCNNHTFNAGGGSTGGGGTGGGGTGGRPGGASTIMPSFFILMTCLVIFVFNVNLIRSID